MLNLLPHHRLHIPNTLAMFAALLLLVSSVVGYESAQESYSSGQETTSSTKVEVTDGDSIDHAVENKHRGLNLGLLLFRR